MGAGVVNDQQVTDVDARQRAVNGKLVVVLAQTTNDVIWSQGASSLPMTVMW